MPFDSSAPSESPAWPQLLAVGAAAATIVALGMVVGWVIDRAAGSAPAFLLVGLAVGVIAAAAYMISQFRKFLRMTGTARKSAE